MLDFSQKAEEKNNDLIPAGTLLWAIMNVRGVKDSKSSSSRYLDVELTIDDTPGQPYARRKIWDMIGDPLHAGNSEEYRNMGLASIRRILEVAFAANPNVPDTYKVLTDYSQMTGKRVAIQVRVEKAKEGSGYDDKNKVEYLSPHSSVKTIVKKFEDLKAGKHAPEGKAAPAAANQQAGFGFTGQGVPPVPPGNSGPDWLAQTAATPGAGQVSMAADPNKPPF